MLVLFAILTSFVLGGIAMWYYNTKHPVIEYKEMVRTEYINKADTYHLTDQRTAKALLWKWGYAHTLKEQPAYKDILITMAMAADSDEHITKLRINRDGHVFYFSDGNKPLYCVDISKGSVSEIVLNTTRAKNTPLNQPSVQTPNNESQYNDAPPPPPEYDIEPYYPVDVPTNQQEMF